MLLNIMAYILYLVVVLAISDCLFDNFDRSVLGVCMSCQVYVETKVASSILLSIVVVATIVLGRHVSVLF